MTKEEAIYWKKFILDVIENKLKDIEVSDVDAMRISEFEENYMQTITGQQPLPQSIFRKFLEIFSKIPQIQAEIMRAQMEIIRYMRNIPADCTRRDVEQMFDGLMWEEYEWMWMPSVCVDADGFELLNVIVDEEGFAHFLEEHMHPVFVDGLMYNHKYMWLPSYNLMDEDGFVHLRVVMGEDGYLYFIN